MKTTIRQSTFETNSSSVHAFVLLPNDFLAQWQARPTEWLNFGALLDEVGAVGAAEVDVPVIAREELLVDDMQAWNARNSKYECGYYLDDEEVVGGIEMLPYEAIENPSLYSVQGLEPVPEGLLVELFYEGWRD